MEVTLPDTSTTNVDVKRVERQQRKRDELHWVKGRNNVVAKRLDRQLKESSTMKGLVASIVRSSPNPANELAEELLFAGSTTHFDALMDSNVSVTSYCRVMEKQVRTTGESPYRSIMSSLRQAKTQPKLMAKFKTKSKTQTRARTKGSSSTRRSGDGSIGSGGTKSQVGLTDHTLLTQRRRKLMMRAMMDTMDGEEVDGETRESARSKLDHFIAYRNPQYLADVDDNETFLLESEDTSRNPSVIELEEMAEQAALLKAKEEEEERERERLEEEEYQRRMDALESDAESDGTLTSDEEEEGEKAQDGNKRTKSGGGDGARKGTAAEGGVKAGTAGEGVLPKLTSPINEAMAWSRPGTTRSAADQRAASARLMSPPKVGSRSQSPNRATRENADPWNPVRFQDVLRDGRPLSPEAHEKLLTVNENFFPSSDLEGPELGAELPSLLNEEEERQSTTKALHDSQLHARANSQRRRKPVKAPRVPQFNPEWRNYDVMRNRWNYIWPQTRQLRHEDEQLVPTDTAKMVTLPRNHIALKGSIFDAGTFSERVSDTEKYYSGILSRTNSLTMSKTSAMLSPMHSDSVSTERSFTLDHTGILRAGSSTRSIA